MYPIQRLAPKSETAFDCKLVKSAAK